MIINPFAVSPAAAAFSLIFDAATKGSNCTLSVGDTRITSTTTAWASARSTTGKSSGKWHVELKVVTLASTGAPGYSPMFGVCISSCDMNSYLYADSGSTCMYGSGSELKYNNRAGGNFDFTPVATPTPPVNTIFGLSIDLDAKKIWLSKNGVFLNSGDPVAGTGALTYTGTPTLYPACSVYGLSAGELVAPIYTPSGFGVW